MVRRVIVDLMLALFAMVFAMAIMSSDNLGKQPKSKNFILIQSLEPDNQLRELEISVPEQSVGSQPTVPLTTTVGTPHNGIYPVTYLLFPAHSGSWKVKNKSSSRKTVDYFTRSGKKKVDVDSNKVFDIKVDP